MGSGAQGGELRPMFQDEISNSIARGVPNLVRRLDARRPYHPGGDGGSSVGSKASTSSKIESNALGSRLNRVLPGECGYLGPHPEG